MSRRRWIVLLGPPLLAGRRPPLPGSVAGQPVPRSAVIVAAPPRSITACPARAPAVHRAPGGAAVPGAWWRTQPPLDDSGSLAGWSLQVGAPGAPASARSSIPAASTVTGPRDGRVVVASEGPASEHGSTVRIVDAASGCATEIRVARPDRAAGRRRSRPGLASSPTCSSRARAATSGSGGSTLDGRIAERVLEPLPDALRAAAGIDRVWATDLRLDATAARLAVQSCHPDACVTRVVDLARATSPSSPARARGRSSGSPAASSSPGRPATASRARSSPGTSRGRTERVLAARARPAPR